MKHHLSVFAFLLCLSFSTILVADISDNTDFIEAIKKYYEIVDKAKLAYENELRKVLANTQKAGNLPAYNAIEAELNHTIGKNGHSITPFEPPKNSSMYIKKSTLKRAVDSARIGFKKYADSLASELLKDGNVKDARDVATITKAIEPPRFYIENVAIKEMNLVEAIIYPLPDDRKPPQAKLSKRLTGRQGRINQAEWSKDGTFIVTSGKDHYVAVWDAKTGRLLSVLNSPTGSTGGVMALSKDNKHVFFGGRTEVGLWDFSKNRIVWKKPVNTWATNFAVSPDGNTLCLCARGGLSILDAATGKTLQTLEGHNGYLLRACFFDNGNRLISSSEGKTILVWDTKTWKSATNLKGHKGDAYGIAVSPDNSIIATGSYDRSITIWDTKTLKPLHKLNLNSNQKTGEFQKGVIALAFSPNGRLLAVGQNDEETIILDTNIWNPICVAPLRGAWSTKISWSPDSRFFVTCGDTLCVWEAPNFR